MITLRARQRCDVSNCKPPIDLKCVMRNYVIRNIHLRNWIIADRFHELSLKTAEIKSGKKQEKKMQN